jgi:hypothetical protein
VNVGELNRDGFQSPLDGEQMSINPGLAPVDRIVRFEIPSNKNGASSNGSSAVEAAAGGVP